MKAWTENALLWLRVNRAQGYPMSKLVDLNWPHTRDEVVEAIDALRRFGTDYKAALSYVIHVQSCQYRGVPLINGRIAESVMRPWTDEHPAPQA